MACPGCEKRDAGDLISPEKIAELADQIPLDPRLRAEEAVYERRLAVCTACESLKGAVLCAHCGCFVLFRARPADSYCPHPEGGKWV